MEKPKFDYQALWVRLNRPSPERFQAALKKRGIPAPGVAFLREHFFRWQSSKQLFAPGPKYTGHIYAPGLNTRWVADVMVNTQRPSEHEGKLWSFALVVQDIFSRFAWAELIDSPMHADEGLRKIFERAKPPDNILTDADPGFRTPEFEALLREKGVVQELRAGRNDMATVDRLIFTLKRAMAEEEAETGRGWAAALQDAVRGHNESGQGHLYGAAPEDVRDRKSASLEFDLEWDESHAMRDNAEKIHARAKRLEERGAYRVYQPVKGLRRRANQPIWGRELHKVDKVQGAFVDGHPTKEVLAVPKDSTVLAPEKVPKNYDARQALVRYASRVAGFLSGNPDNTASSQRVANTMVTIAGSRQNLLAAFRLAGVSAREVVSSLVRVYPDYFRLADGKVTYVGAEPSDSEAD